MSHPLIAPYVRVSYTALHHYRLKRCFSQYFSGLISAGLFPIFFSSTSGDRRKLTTLSPDCLYNPLVAPPSLCRIIWIQLSLLFASIDIRFNLLGISSNPNHPDFTSSDLQYNDILSFLTRLLSVLRHQLTPRYKLLSHMR